MRKTGTFDNLEYFVDEILRLYIEGPANHTYVEDFRADKFCMFCSHRDNLVRIFIRPMRDMFENEPNQDATAFMLGVMLGALSIICENCLYCLRLLPDEEKIELFRSGLSESIVRSLKKRNVIK